MSEVVTGTRKPLSRVEAAAVMGIALNSWRFIREAGEEEAADDGARRRALAWNDRYDPDFASGEGWASYAHPNPTRHLIAALTAGDVHAGDQVLDLGAGDGRLSLLAVMSFRASKAVAIEADNAWVQATRDFMSRFPNGWTGEPWNRVEYRTGAWQDQVPFPLETTVAFFIAWHCGPRMRQSVLEALAPTKCRALVDNFGVRTYTNPEHFNVTLVPR